MYTISIFILYFLLYIFHIFNIYIYDLYDIIYILLISIFYMYDINIFDMYIIRRKLLETVKNGPLDVISESQYHLGSRVRLPRKSKQAQNSFDHTDDDEVVVSESQYHLDPKHLDDKEVDPKHLDDFDSYTIKQLKSWISKRANPSGRVRDDFKEQVNRTSELIR